MTDEPHIPAIADPFALFEAWFADAKAGELNDPDAMSLATATPDGRPSVRMLLLKGHGPDGFVFYTNLNSRKGGEIAANPFAAICFHWKSLRRQVRAEGGLEPVSDADADRYFASRSRDSRIGAWASDQSAPLDDRATFLNRIDSVRARFGDEDVPRPPNWSGFCLKPDAIEFWLDGAFRMHDRVLYRRDGDSWSTTRLYP